ncbi:MULTISPECIES: MFS transporter [Sinorhizobium]|uniref:MFS transporter n=1 Tax=Sinorhizobium TaxID=28105 RepID=UPI001F27FA78|nr:MULTISPECIES: MFS transporter [Sinorhizobium]
MVATGIVAYSMIVAGFVMLGAKLVQRFGALRVFRLAVIVFGLAQVLMTFSPNATAMITAQALCGAAGAVIVPALIALIAENYHGTQQATALGALGSARAGAGVLALLIGGVLGTYIGWRPVSGILIAVSALVLLLSFRLKPDHGRPEVRIGFLGVLLAATAIILISFGFNNLNGSGLALARPTAPFNVLGLSPAPILILIASCLARDFCCGRGAARRPTLSIEIQSQVNLDSITFASNERLESIVAATTATPDQKAEALRINTEARLRALKLGFLMMAGLALLTILPAGKLPNYRPGEIPEG